MYNAYFTYFMYFDFTSSMQTLGQHATTKYSTSSKCGHGKAKYKNNSCYLIRVPLLTVFWQKNIPLKANILAEAAVSWWLTLMFSVQVEQKPSTVDGCISTDLEQISYSSQGCLGDRIQLANGDTWLCFVVLTRAAWICWGESIGESLTPVGWYR